MASHVCIRKFGLTNRSVFKASDLKMELRSLFHLNHFVVLPYSVFHGISRTGLAPLEHKGLSYRACVLSEPVLLRCRIWGIRI